MNSKQAFLKSFNSIKSFLPIMIGVLLLVNLFIPAFKKMPFNIFTGNSFSDLLAGSLLGSISFGIPVTSFIVGGELLNQGVGLMAITAFILAWATVGMAMLPLEIISFGKKFAIVRNGVCFIFSMFVAALTVFTLNVIQSL